MANTHFSTHAKVLMGIGIGNIMEWYAFTIFVQFLARGMQLFFPLDPIKTQMVIALLFAAGFLLRPVGGIIYAHFGDKYGRLQTLIASIFLMFIPTFLIGILPSYQTIGIFAPVLLIVFRLMQGLSAGGEFPGSFIFAVEFANPNLRGLYGSIPFCTAIIGMLCGTLSHSIVDYYSTADNLINLWRVPFFISVIIAIIGIYFLRNISENQIFIKLKLSQRTANAPVFEAVKTHSWNILIGIGISAISACTVYLMYIYMSRFLNEYLLYKRATSIAIIDFSLLILVIFIPLMGYLSDRIGRKPVLFCGIFGFLIDAYPLYLLFSQKILIYTVIAQIILGILGACVIAPLPTLLVELFPTRVRYSCVAIAYNLAFVIFGGLAPLATLYLVKYTNNYKSPSLFLMFAGIISLLALFKIPETYKKTISG